MLSIQNRIKSYFRAKNLQVTSFGKSLNVEGYLLTFDEETETITVINPNHNKYTLNTPYQEPAHLHRKIIDKIILPSKVMYSADIAIIDAWPIKEY